MRKIITFLAAAVVTLSLAACEDEHKGEHCVRSHTDIIPVVTIVNNVPVTNIVPVETCDEWAPDNTATVKP